MRVTVPWCVGIAAEDGERLVERDRRAIPSGHRVEWNVEACLQRHLFQGADVLDALAFAGFVILIFDLDADDGAAIFP